MHNSPAKFGPNFCGRGLYTVPFVANDIYHDNASEHVPGFPSYLVISTIFSFLEYRSFFLQGSARPRDTQFSPPPPHFV